MLRLIVLFITGSGQCTRIAISPPFAADLLPSSVRIDMLVEPALAFGARSHTEHVLGRLQLLGRFDARLKFIPAVLD